MKPEIRNKYVAALEQYGINDSRSCLTSKYAIECDAVHLESLVFKNASVLDLCCGNAAILPKLVNFGMGSYTGVDLLPEFIKRLNQIYKNSDYFKFENEDLFKYVDEYNGDKFDIVILNDVLNYFTKDKVKDVIAKILDKVGNTLTLTLYTPSDKDEEFGLDCSYSFDLAQYLLQKYTCRVQRGTPPDRIRITLWNNG